MLQGSRPERVGDLIRGELSVLLTRQVKDPGIGFVTFTDVRVTSDLQLARIYYSSLADERGRRDTARALARAAPFLRRQLGRRLRLKRVPNLEFIYDDSVERQDRVAQILQELNLPGRVGDTHAGTDDRNHH